jgi:hypothetical protein
VQNADDKPQPSTAYPFTEIEARWQEYWEKNQTFRTPEELDTSKPKYYVLDMFPYPRWAIHSPTAMLNPHSHVHWHIHVSMRSP